MKKPSVALGPFLSHCPSVTTLGIRPTFAEYSTEERALLRSARIVFFPSPRHARVLHAAGIPTFPGLSTYIHRASRLHHLLLIKTTGYPVPRTRFYYGKHRSSAILRDFSLPLLILPPANNPAQRVLKIFTPQDFANHCLQWNPLIVQESISWEKRLALVCTNFEIVGASCKDGPREHLDPLKISRGEDRRFRDPVRQTRELLEAAGLDDICVEWGFGNNSWHVLALNRPPVRWSAPGGIIHRFALIGDQIASGKL